MKVNPIAWVLGALALVGLVAAYWVLRAMCKPCESCGWSFCGCTGGELPSLPLLAADTDPDAVAARNFAASVRAGYVQQPVWDPKPNTLRLPEPPKEAGHGS